MAIFTNKVFPSSGEAGSGGGIIQVVTNSSTSQTQVNGTGTWTDVSPTCSITMHESGNKVLVFLSAGIGMEWCGTTSFRLLRGSTTVQTTGGYCWNNTRWQYAPPPFQGVLDAPGSGTHTYKVQIKTSRNSQMYYNWNIAESQTAHMTLMEVSS